MRYRVLSDWARVIDRELLKPLKSTGEINARSLGGRFGVAISGNVATVARAKANGQSFDDLA